MKSNAKHFIDPGHHRQGSASGAPEQPDDGKSRSQGLFRRICRGGRHNHREKAREVYGA